MRIRSIKPEFWQDPECARWDDACQLAYLALFSAADDWGRLNADPGFLRGVLFPYKSRFPMERALNLFQEVGKLYVWDGKCGPFGLLVNFARHQIVNRRGMPLIEDPPIEGLRKFLVQNGKDAGEAEGMFPTDAERELYAARRKAGTFSERSVNGHEAVSDNSSGNREQGTGSREQGAGMTLAAAVEMVRMSHPDCRRLPQAGIENSLRSFPPEVWSEAVEAFGRDWAGSVFCGAATPMKELRKYCSHGERRRQAAGTGADTAAGAVGEQGQSDVFRGIE